MTAMIKGKPHTFAIKGGDAATGSLKTLWEGAYPAKGATGKPYDLMEKQGAIDWPPFGKGVWSPLNEQLQCIRRNALYSRHGEN
jgi:hypothetical protein